MREILPALTEVQDEPPPYCNVDSLLPAGYWFRGSRSDRRFGGVHKPNPLGFPIAATSQGSASQREGVVFAIRLTISCWLAWRPKTWSLRAEAGKVTLLRRLSLDMIGLPPDIAAVDALRGDRGQKAYQRQVEQMLCPAHFGERWGRAWLDGARYADSDGYEKDKRRTVWRYRDYVIDAMNRDMPYNQFIIEQIAGDQLPNATQDQKVATGFLRNSMVNEEGGIDPEQFRMEAMFDRMDCIGKSILGLTIGCAQCHNHKFRPTCRRNTTGCSPSSTTTTRASRSSILPTN